MDGARDVTQGYVADWRTALQRRRAGWEDRIKSILAVFTAQRRQQYTAPRLAQLAYEDIQESLWLANSGERAQAAREIELQGRQSGTAAWRQARGETGMASHNRPEGGKLVGTCIRVALIEAS